MKGFAAPPTSRLLFGLAVLVLAFAAYAYVGMAASAAESARYGEVALATLAWGAIAIVCLLVSAGLGVAAWRSQRKVRASGESVSHTSGN